MYTGEDGLATYLSPLRDEYVPLVELPSALNPFLESHNIHLSAKLMNTLPLQNVKSIPAYSLLQSSKVADKRVVESSSGNTVFSMGLLAQSMGAQDVTAVASADVSRGKLQLLQLAGIHVRLVDGPICPDAHDPDSSISIARRLGARDGWCNPGQYDNDANPHSHELFTGPQLYDQLGDLLGMFVAGLGTTGTLTGTARYLRKQIPAVKIGGVLRAPNNKVPGVRTRNGLKEVAFDWGADLTEQPVVINEKQSYEASLQLIRSGLLVGPSSGFAYQGALATIASCIERGEHAELQGKHVVFVCPDTCFPYVSEYFEVLDEDHFPAIDNRSTQPSVDVTQLSADIPEVSIDGLYEDIKSARPQYTIIDVRSTYEFSDHHIAGSQLVPLEKIPDWLQSLSAEQKARSFVFVCSRTARSLRAAALAQRAGLRAAVLAGGTAAWSAAGYDRSRPALCSTS